MLKISKMMAYQCVVEAIDKNDYKTANEIMNIINKSIINDKKHNIISDEIVLHGTKEEKYFRKFLKME